MVSHSVLLKNKRLPSKDSLKRGLEVCSIREIFFWNFSVWSLPHDLCSLVSGELKPTWSSFCLLPLVCYILFFLPNVHPLLFSVFLPLNFLYVFGSDIIAESSC